MPITTVAWIMMLILVVTYTLLNIFENKKMDKAGRRKEKDRRHFSYSVHIPERRSDNDRRINNDNYG